MSNEKHPSSKVTMRSLWREFIPLSLSDVTMACGDPLITTTLAHLPDSRMNISAVGIAKSLAVFFESPIIMILHASNALAGGRASRKALWRFTLLCCSLLTVLLFFLSLPSIFAWVGMNVLGIDQNLMERARVVLSFLMLWPAAIGWRRYFQGLLIHTGHSRVVGQASIARLAAVISILMYGFWSRGAGVIVAGFALLGGILTEALFVTVAAIRLRVTRSHFDEKDEVRPTNVRGVFNFYWPLANSMMVVWGGRALLVAIIARSIDAAIALAAWPAAWGIVLVIANATRMVQQVIIRNRKYASFRLLMGFAFSVGILCSLLLLVSATTSLGRSVLEAFVGDDTKLLLWIRPVILLCSLVPLFIAMQNGMQGFLIGESKTGRINSATWVGTAVLLVVSAVAVTNGVPGATAAAIAMLTALFVESLWLARGMLRLHARESQEGRENSIVTVQ